jgi:ribonuclease P protein component
VLFQARERFPKRTRLTRRSEFLNLSREGKKVHTSHFIVITKANDKGENRLGVTVSTRVGKAVVRNRIKRLLREFFRRHRGEFSLYEDIVIIAKKGAGELSLNEVSSELSKAFADQGSRQR